MSDAIKKRMLDALPRYYYESKEAVNLIERESAEFDRLNGDIRDVLDQFFVGTATWSLPRWETIVGVKTDVNKTLEQRRSIVKAKLRGTGTVTLAVLESIADAFFTDVKAEEEPRKYTVVIVVGGIPPNLYDAYVALRELAPAHVDVVLAPMPREAVEVVDEVTVSLKRYHTIGELRVGYTIGKDKREVAL
ncbi:putative phage tail protein [Brevibacillus daliensis]|uniref:putative phage tail protein n=1 Tax=Brevibacillus daliensis TaxID=2892995 RepID=UPI001E5C4747|nr:putative phage tail protein [Brevibacillus daliensis]